MMSVVTDVVSNEGVLHLCARVNDEMTLRFHVPRSVLEWTPGQAFFCYVNAPSMAGIAAPKDTVCTMRGTVMKQDAGIAILSVGGLPMQLPAPSSEVGDLLVIHLVPIKDEKRRLLRRKDVVTTASVAPQRPRRR